MRAENLSPSSLDPELHNRDKVVPPTCLALGSLIPFVPNEILGSSQGGRNYDGYGRCLTKENFLLVLCRSRFRGGPRVWNVRRGTRGEGTGLAARLPDRLQADPTQPGVRSWRAGTGLDGCRHPKNQAQDMAGQRDSGTFCRLETITCSLF